MNLDLWLRNRLGWLITPVVVGNSLAVAVAGPWAASVESFSPGALQVFLLLTVGLALGLQLTLIGASLSRLRAFRGLVSGRLPVTREHRLAALGELRRAPAHLASLSLFGWLLGVALLGLGMVALADAPWLTGLRLGLVGVLFGPLATVLVSLLITTRVHEASDRLSAGLPPHDVIAAAPGVNWSVRGRTVGFTVLLTVIPVLVLADVAWVALGRAPAELATLAPAARQAAADALFSDLALRLSLLGLLSVGFAVIAAAAAGQSIAGPLQRLAEQARRVAEGHLETPRVIAADGEVWRVTGVFGQLHERLAGLVDKVLEAGAHVHTATDSLQATSERSESTAAEQAAALNETSATTEELARSARQIAASAGSVLELARRTLEAAQQGQSDAAAFQAAVDRMKQDNRSIAGAVDRLRRRVQQIGRIVELINAVADRSDLLALSAELEGTRAGDVGRGFSLVGAEMRRLAENVLESTAEVEELIAEIRDATIRTAEATERGSNLTERGTSLAGEVTTSLSRVAELALETSNQVRTITLATQQQQSGTDQLAEAMADILTGTQSEQATHQRLAEVNQRLLGLSGSLQGVVGRFTGQKGTPPPVSGGRDRLLAQFREFVTERLARINRALMTLESGADDEAGKQTLRELHGLKGEARMMGFVEVNALVHEMEELVRAAQGRGYALAGGSVDALLVVSDAVAVLAGAVAGEPPEVDRLLGWLKQATGSEQAAGGPPPSAPSTISSRSAVEAPRPSAPSAIEGPPPSAPASRVSSTGSLPTQAVKAVEPSRSVDASIRITQHSLEVLTSATNNLQQRARQTESTAARRRQLSRELVALHRLSEDLGPAGADLAARLGRAKELASELNRRASMLATEELKDLSVLSEEITALRMVPLSVLFESYPRMVRELAKDLGKELDLVIEGEDERVDRSVLDALKDPLLHLVRNAVDHGLESREERVDQGKSPRGRVQLQARREGERLVLRVKDDGQGLSAAHLREVAVRKGLLDAPSAAGLSDAAAIDLVFLSGFSSREAVSDVSGRGLGLDVVRTRLLAVGGEVTVQTSPGAGSSFELRVPVSLTVAPVLFVQVGEERLCLAASNVVRAFTVELAQQREIAGKPALLVDDEVLPFSSVASLLFAAPERPPSEGELVLVLRGRGQSAAIAVDRVLEERVQAVLPLKGLLARYPHLSGATPLSDGDLALVLSAPHLVATVHGRELRLGAAASRRQEVRRQKVLVVDDSPLTRELLVSLLESVGYQIFQAVDGAQALEVLSREAVDIVVTDLEMPNVDGLELTRRLKSHGTWRALPVVIVTTRGSEVDRRRGMEAGADGYVTKGDLVRQDLVDVVARLLA